MSQKIAVKGALRKPSTSYALFSVQLRMITTPTLTHLLRIRCEILFIKDISKCKTLSFIVQTTPEDVGSEATEERKYFIIWIFRGNSLELIKLSSISNVTLV